MNDSDMENDQVDIEKIQASLRNDLRGFGKCFLGIILLVLSFLSAFAIAAVFGCEENRFTILYSVGIPLCILSFAVIHFASREGISEFH